MRVLKPYLDTEYTFFVFQYSKNYEGTKTKFKKILIFLLFQYSKNYEGTKTEDDTVIILDLFQYSKNYEGTKTYIYCSIVLV